MSQKINNAVKSFRPTTIGFTRDIYLLDASKEPVGRLATKAATILMGKNRPDFSPDVNMGGKIVIINSDKLIFSGQKMQKKNYFRHSQRPGSLKITTMPQQMEKDSTVPLYKAIRNMIPRNRLKDIRMNQLLSIYKGDHDLTQKMIVAN
jgi:large subunit ribosomal protein L13